MQGKLKQTAREPLDAKEQCGEHMAQSLKNIFLL